MGLRYAIFHFVRGITEFLLSQQTILKKNTNKAYFSMLHLLH